MRTVFLVGRAPKADMHMGRMAIPWSDDTQPASLACHIPAELPFDSGIHQNPIDLGQTGSDPQQRHYPRRPCGGINIAPIRTDQASQFHRVPLSFGQRQPLMHIQTDIRIQANLVADMTTLHRPAASQ